VEVEEEFPGSLGRPNPTGWNPNEGNFGTWKLAVGMRSNCCLILWKMPGKKTETNIKLIIIFK